MKISTPWYERFQPVLLAALGILVVVWLALTPPGLLGKADAIGYAVCHRIAERSFFLGDRAVPLCSRCSGMYLGALAGFLFQLRLGKRANLPPRRVQAFFAVFLLAFALDGINSYITFFPQLPHLYDPQNSLRLLTGTLLGVGMTGLLLPTFHQVVWQQWDERPALGSIRQLIGVVVLAGVIAGSIASENPLLVYPLALLSIASLLALLVTAYSLVWTLLLKRENTFTTWKQLRPVLVLAILTTFTQIAAIDAFRYWLTGTWNGFSL